MTPEVLALGARYPAELWTGALILSQRWLRKPAFVRFKCEIDPADAPGTWLEPQLSPSNLWAC